MDVAVDNVWASPSTLHMRVTVWNDARTWRHKYDVAVPLAEIPPEALQPLTQPVGLDRWVEGQEALF